MHRDSGIHPDTIVFGAGAGTDWPGMSCSRRFRKIPDAIYIIKAVEDLDQVRQRVLLMK